MLCFRYCLFTTSPLVWSTLYVSLDLRIVYSIELKVYTAKNLIQCWVISIFYIGSQRYGLCDKWFCLDDSVFDRILDVYNNLYFGSRWWSFLTPCLWLSEDDFDKFHRFMFTIIPQCYCYQNVDTRNTHGQHSPWPWCSIH